MKTSEFSSEPPRSIRESIREKFSVVHPEVGSSRSGVFVGFSWKAPTSMK